MSFVSNLTLQTDEITNRCIIDNNVTIVSRITIKHIHIARTCVHAHAQKRTITDTEFLAQALKIQNKHKTHTHVAHKHTFKTTAHTINGLLQRLSAY